MAETIIQIDTGKFINAFLIRGDPGCVLVDTGNPGKADRILERLAKHGVAPDAVRLILITHGHIDHFGSAAELRERTGAPVAIYALDADAVRQGIHQPDSLQPTGRLIALLMRISALRNFAVPDRAPAFEPDIVFEGEWRIACLQHRHPQLVALSPHDSCAWSIQTFRRAFEGAYRDVQVGEETVIQ